MRLGGRRKGVENPAGLIIYSLEKEMPIPADFMSSRKKRAQEEARNQQSRAEGERVLEQLAYAEWLDGERDRLVVAQFSQSELDRKLIETIAHLNSTDERFGRMPAKARTDFAKRMLRKELAAHMELPSFDEWRNSTPQASLF